MSDNVHVTAIFHIRDDCIDRATAMFKELAIPTRAESGCVEYGFYQSLDDASLILATETWKDAEAFAAHLASAHLKNALDRVAAYLSAEPVIHQCKKIV